MKIRGRDNKLNNRGFTLIEVLVAVIILAIASIPILRAFVTSANNSGKAKIKLKATNVAENIMEDIKGMTIDDISEKYAGVRPAVPNARGKFYEDGGGSAADEQVAYEYKIDSSWSGTTKADKEISDMLKNGYKATIHIDPSYYPNINSVNMASFDTVSSNTAAIFSLSESAEESVYKEYEDRNGRLEIELANKDSEYFKEHLKREIRIDIKKNGKVTDSNGVENDNVTVTATVSYYIDEDSVVPAKMETKKAYSSVIFDNSATGNKLSAVFVMYPPRYANATDNGDIIIVHNRDSVVTNLYVIAQETATTGAVDGKWDDYLDKDNGALILHIYEDKVDGEEPITLFTNLHDDVDYKKSDSTAVKPVKCYINLAGISKDPEGAKDVFDKSIYESLIKARKSSNYANKETTKALHARDTDGRLLDASGVNDRIYDVWVEVEKEAPGSDEWPVKVKLTGTLVQDADAE